MTRKKQTGSETSATTKTVRTTRGKKTSQNTSEDLRYVSINEILDTRFRLKCRNAKQKELVKLIDEKDVVFAYGPAGTGKSYTAIAKGIELLQTNPEKYKTIKVIKPVVESGESYGFLPGSLKEKLEPHIQSSIDIIEKIIGVKNRISLESAGILVIEALGFVRGKTIDNSILIVEEAQNMTPQQMKNLLTRIGENSKFIISGDLDQSDRYKDVTKSGLYDALKKFRRIEECGFLEFDVSEIVRHPLIGKFLNEYKRAEELEAKRIPEPPKPQQPRVINESEVPKKDGEPKKLNWFQKNFKW